MCFKPDLNLSLASCFRASMKILPVVITFYSVESFRCAVKDTEDRPGVCLTRLLRCPAKHGHQKQSVSSIEANYRGLWDDTANGS